ncbi:SAM-dependent methyltransferase [Actinomadura rayongensis]|uniref:SAM-dependent methyltransferase n=1 Tax=Actinomadura rayongensis TaxID=1429076 RepID=A0A6I4W4J8_9ACTN|nr:SAM-dependent methyltransferase [Actinomadura rayongensis]MXQ65609.1 hypothetical protein [Actinomadura rayongensis]
MLNQPLDAITSVPSSARGYDWLLGGKDHYDVDRRLVLDILSRFPANLDAARANRRFLRRAVRHLVQAHGVQQFIDLGCGLPTSRNVHQIAQEIDPQARVVYVDNDPVVLAHGRALLADDTGRTVVVTADFRDARSVLDDPAVEQLIDFHEPFAVLLFSVGHHLPDEDEPRQSIDTLLTAGPRVNYLAFSQAVDEDAERGAHMADAFSEAGILWQTRTPAQVDELLTGLDAVGPGRLMNVAHWLPDPHEPPLPPVPDELKPYVGASHRTPGAYEYGGVLRLP